MHIKLLLCDDHGILRDGLREILVKQGLEVVGEASDGREAVELARRLRPDVVLMDISLPGMSGIVATRRLHAELPATKVIGLSMHADRRYALAMLAAGAQGYVVKSSVSDELFEALRAVQADQTYVSPTITGITVEERSAAAASAREGRRFSLPHGTRTLSVRERDVLQLIADGLSSKEVGAQLGIAVTTVETHRRQIMDKLNLRSIAELTKYAVRTGLTSID